MDVDCGYKVAIGGLLFSIPSTICTFLLKGAVDLPSLSTAQVEYKWFKEIQTRQSIFSPIA